MSVVELDSGMVLKQIFPLGFKGSNVRGDPTVGKLWPRVVN